MKRFLYFMLFPAIILSSSCSQKKTESIPEGKANAAFELVANRYIDQLLKLHPVWATQLGVHQHDGNLYDYSSEAIASEIAFHKSYLDSLKGINLSELSAVNQTDYKILKTGIESSIYDLESLREYEWNPMTYNVGDAIYSLTAREFAPLKDRLLSVKSRLAQIPKVLAAAKKNLKSTSKIHTETAIRQNDGLVSLVKDELNTYLDQVPELKAEFAPVQAEAIAAIEDFGKWMKSDLLPKATGDFRLGEEKYKQKLRYSLDSDLSKEDILKAAEADLQATQDKMYELSLPLYKEYFPKETDASKLADKKAVIKSVLKKVAESHPTNETIVAQAKAYLDSCAVFVKAKGLVTVPTDPIEIIVMPEYQRGVAVAYCDSPGAFEKNGKTFYAISPTPKDWTKERAESFYREYNDFMLQNLTVHEAMPGHYLQLMHANQFKAPTKVRALFQSGTFIEGWATHSEQFMAEAGFSGVKLHLQQLKMRLRLIINSIIDQKIHTAGMTEKEAIDLMMNSGFQEDGEAAGKWRRACLTSTQLSTYYVGNLEWNNLRKAATAKEGAKFNLKSFHDTALSFGSPSLKYVREAMGL